ncbi:MAG: MMPL family transporter [Acholeplasmataceae bacterium]
MKKLTSLIMKYPIKTFIIAFVIMIALVIGVTKVELKTGNDTLISDQTDIYIENESYQSEFGKDPIILIFEEDEIYETSTLALINELHQNLENLDGIYAINSPVTVINQVSLNMYNQTEEGLNQMSMGLNELSVQLGLLSSQLATNDSNDSPDIEMITSNLTNLVNTQNQLNTGLINLFDMVNVLNSSVVTLKTDLNTLKFEIEQDPTLTEELQLAESSIAQTEAINQSLYGLLQQETITQIPEQTSIALNQMMLTLVELSETLNGQLESMQTLSQALYTMSTNLGNIASNLSMIHANFNVFEPGFPSSSETLEMMIFDEEKNVKEMFSNFVVNDTQLRMIIVLNGNVTDQEIDVIHETILETIALEDSEEQVLVSGKPILDRSIKSSMMNSMQFMMISAIVIMVLILLFIYKVRMRLLPIIMILFAVIATIGMMGWLSIGLTMVSMAVFPVLIGLGIDYFIQFQTRYEEERG